ncbi:acyltransferase family protein [Clostridium cibarium]|uniref:acyltransferase family protein n=1 Tax=Clostridium cibarium TaxID=2762247 RepID=UPI0024337602|nr:acyltransferase family protein [Clostridium cibarium]
MVDYISNITTTFGFFDPESYISAGAWSIGNEMVYYVMTPIVIIAYNRKKIFGNILFIVSLIIGYLFAFIFLDPNIDLNMQWGTYVNPFNNFFFYVGGIAIYYNLKDIKFNRYFNNIIVLISIAVFCFIPISGNQIMITTLIWRIVFSVLCFVIVIGFYKLKLNIPEVIGRSFELFGIATYGVYLLHPVVYNIINFIFIRLKLPSGRGGWDLLIVISVSLGTILLALISYYKFELKFMRYGKKLFIINKKET